ncbi:hypothetical protein C8R45DRAFT_1212500 [Mycena sanguinolenta]|nr:hypothetical protein C8R45DRAFT_1212500 [Mycena sanguinolenta]
MEGGGTADGRAQGESVTISPPRKRVRSACADAGRVMRARHPSRPPSPLPPASPPSFPSLVLLFPSSLIPHRPARFDSRDYDCDSSIRNAHETRRGSALDSVLARIRSTARRPSWAQFEVCGEGEGGKWSGVEERQEGGKARERRRRRRDEVGSARRWWRARWVILQVRRRLGFAALFLGLTWCARRYAITASFLYFSVADGARAGSVAKGVRVWIKWGVVAQQLARLTSRNPIRRVYGTRVRGAWAGNRSAAGWGERRAAIALDGRARRGGQACLLVDVVVQRVSWRAAVEATLSILALVEGNRMEGGQESPLKFVGERFVGAAVRA